MSSSFASLRRLSAPLLALSCVLGSVFSVANTERARADLSLTRAADPAGGNDIELHQALLDLTNPWTVMCVAAHPDDEDGTSLIVMRRKFGIHTVSVFSTFGEGGQNAIGPELYEELGAIRARETMAAAEIQGSEAHFLGLKDFGYSKSADEAFRIWGHDEALRRMVEKIRELRPDVIITNHDTTSGHGHHQATGRLVLEAFDEAADPKYFPEQLKDGLTAWQVQRLFVRAGFGNRTPEAQADQPGLVTIDPNELDPIRGKPYAEQALQALQKHATQGPWPKTLPDMARFRNLPDGRLPSIRYRLVREAGDARPLPPDSHYLFAGLRLPEELERRLQPPTIDGRPLTDFLNQQGRILDTLIAAARNQVFGEPVTGVSSQSMLAQDRRARMLTRLNHSLAVASRVSASLLSSDAVLIPGVTSSFELAITNGGESSIRVASIASGVSKDQGPGVFSAHRVVNSALSPGATIRVPLKYATPVSADLTVPHSEHLYDAGFEGQPVAASAVLELNGLMYPIQAHTFLDVVPAVEIADIRPPSLVITPQTVNNPSPLVVRLINHGSDQTAGRLLVSTGTSDLFGGIESGTAFELLRGQSREVPVPLTTNFSSKEPGKDRTSVQDTLTLSIARGAERRGRKQVGQRLVPVAYTEARVAPGVSVGYVRGFDYSLANALAALGVEAKELTVADVRGGDFQKYSAIIVDNRVYESQPELIAANERLLDYAKGGGTLIVFYHKSNEWNPDPRRNRPQLAPYKLILGDQRITDENAPVTFVEPEHPLLNFPNKLGQDDFAGWIQERGLYYPRDWDERYHALLQASDPGEPSLRGGLLVADYGRGHYIYTSMVWYRQLRASVPGAYRTFANMISYGRR